MNKAVFQLILCSLLWSCGGIFIKLVALNSMAIAGWRSVISLVFLCIATRKFPELYKKDEDGRFDPAGSFNLIAGGVFYALTLVFFVIGTKHTTAANAILLQYTNSIYIIIFAPLLLKEKNNLLDYIIVSGLICGMVLLVGGELKQGSAFGNLMALLSGVTYGFTTLFLRRQKDSSPVESLKLSNFLSFLICLPVMIKSGLPDARSCLFLLILGTFQIGLASLLFASGVKGVTALNSAVITMIEPLMNPVWVAVFAHEIPAASSVAGGAIILFFIVLNVVLKNCLNRKSETV